jgi:protocatechuate 3,4-dioxygenase beta subunit
VSLRSRVLSAAAGCRLLPQQAEGPYHRLVHPERTDIAEGRPGVPLRLALRLLDADGRTPLAGAAVDVWQADASGRYSGYPAMPVKDDDVPLRAEDVPDDVVAPAETFLRGSQRTDDDGVCAFETVWPGWYSGRTVHVHVQPAPVCPMGARSRRSCTSRTISTTRCWHGRSTGTTAEPGTRPTAPTASTPTADGTAR